MEAAVLHTPGEPPVFGTHPDPEPLPGLTVVRVLAAPVVPLDLLCASGTSYFGRPATPYVPGVQGVGVVEHSEALPVGARVWFATSAGMAAGDGSMGALCAVPDRDVVLLTEDVPDPLVAALGLSAVAAWMALTWRAALTAGESVLVLGAGGAVGQVGIGVARVLGAARVVAVTRSAVGRERATALGADATVSWSEDVEELSFALREATGGSVDVVLDPVFGPGATAACRVLATGGRLVNLGGTSRDDAVLSSAVLRSRSASVLGYTNNALTGEQRRDALTTVLRHAAKGRISVAHESRPLSAVTEAWLDQASGSASSRLVLVP